jgi:hypothetical protein
MVLALVWLPLATSTGQKAPDLIKDAVFKVKPYKRLAITVGFFYNSTIRNINPLSLKANSVMAVFGIPIRVPDNSCLRTRATRDTAF